MDLSVIVPIYGIERFLPDCIDSLLSQTYGDMEIILVDDGSPDACPEICDYYAAVDDRVKVIHKRNGGLVSARKAGLKVANGRYIGYVDGDDWVEPDMYLHMMKIAKNTDADIIAAGFKKDIEGKCTEHRNIIESGIYNYLDIKDKVYPYFIFKDSSYMPGIYTYVWNKLFKKKLLDEVQNGVPDVLTIGEDAACTYPAIVKAKKIAISDGTHYHYRQRNMSMLKAGSNQDSLICKVADLYDFLIEELGNIDEKFSNQIDRYILYMLTSITGGVHLDDRVANPYLFNIEKEDWQRNKRIAVYGAGTLGQHFVRTIKNDINHQVVKWMDPDYQEYRRHHLMVDAPETIADEDYDILIIVTIGAREAGRIKKRFIMMGVEEYKIVMPCFIDINMDKVFYEYFPIKR